MDEVKWKVGTIGIVARMLDFESKDLCLNLQSATCYEGDLWQVTKLLWN